MRPVELVVLVAVLGMFSYTITREHKPLFERGTCVAPKDTEEWEVELEACQVKRVGKQKYLIQCLNKDSAKYNITEFIEKSVSQRELEVNNHRVECPIRFFGGEPQ